MNNEIIRPQDVDQVLFMGEHSFELMEFRVMFPNIGSPDYSTIIYGEPHGILGMFKNERTLSAVENKRIQKQTILLGGRTTLIVLAELHAVDNNRSILDVTTSDLHTKIDDLNAKNKKLESEALLLHQFVKEQGVEDNIEDWMVNKLNLLKVMQKKTQTPESNQSVSLEVGGDQKKTKD